MSGEFDVGPVARVNEEAEVAGVVGGDDDLVALLDQLESSRGQDDVAIQSMGIRCGPTLLASLSPEPRCAPHDRGRQGLVPRPRKKHVETPNGQFEVSANELPADLVVGNLRYHHERPHGFDPSRKRPKLPRIRGLSERPGVENDELLTDGWLAELSQSLVHRGFQNLPRPLVFFWIIEP
ncbi:MAG: hypothetical protein WED87_07585 [Dehalococcoidia bacterium]